MNPWIVVLVVVLVLSTWAWMIDRWRRRREGVFSPGDIAAAARREQGHHDAIGPPPH